MGKYSHGLQVNGVLVGAKAVDGGAGTTLTNPGKVMEDTVNVNPVTFSDQAFKAQGESTPFLVITTRGVRDGQFDLATMDKEVIADLTGGAVSGTGENVVYAAPDGDPIVERTLKFIDSEGQAWLYPRVLIKADLVGQFRNGQLNVLRVQFTVLQPEKSGVKPFYYGNAAA